MASKRLSRKRIRNAEDTLRLVEGEQMNTVQLRILLKRAEALGRPLVGGGFGGGGGSQTVKTEIPKEMKPLISNAVGQAIDLQNIMPITGFAGSNPQQIPGLTPQQLALIQATMDYATNPSLQTTNPELAAWDTSQALTGGLMGYAGSPSMNATVQSGLNLAQGSSGPNSFQTSGGEFAGAGAEMSPAEQEALAQLGFFTGGQLGQSPATLAATRAFNQFSVPEIEQQLALAGLGRSGAVGTSIGDAQVKAMIPLLATEMANRLQATGMTADIGQAAQGRKLQAGQIMGNIGGDVGKQGLGAAQLIANTGLQSDTLRLQAAQQAATIAAQQAAAGQVLANRARADTQAALEAAGLPREIAAQQAEAAYNDYIRQQQLSEAATLGPLGQVLPSTIGQVSKTSGGGGMFGS